MMDPQDIAGRLDRLRDSMQQMQERLERIESQVAAVVRATMMRDTPADAVADIDRRRFAYFSQHDEDGLLYALFGYVGVTNKSFVEIGCGGNGGNSGFLARECGWTGLMVDANKRAVKKAEALYDRRHVRFATRTVSSGNVAALFAQFKVPREPDLVSVDIDSTDYWVFDAVAANYRPRVVVVEYNSIFGPTAAVTIPDADVYERPRSGIEHYCFGASLSALTRLANTRGYRLAFTDPTGSNAVFVRNDLAPELPGVDAAHAFRYYIGHWKVVHDIDDVVDTFRQKGLALVDV
jgi:hypothetical protein